MVRRHRARLFLAAAGTLLLCLAGGCAAASSPGAPAVVTRPVEQAAIATRLPEPTQAPEPAEPLKPTEAPAPAAPKTPAPARTVRPAPRPTPTRVAHPVGRATPTAAAAASPQPAQQPTLSPQEEMAQIDQLLAASMPGSIAYNVPRSMVLNETAQVQLLLSPSESPEELKAQITPGGEVVAATINITPRMQAKLRADDPDAFAIQALHVEAVQLVSNVEPTEWRWAVTARQDGLQKLHLTLSRLVEYDGQPYWRTVKEYEGTIQIEVTLGQRLARFDWYWLAGIVLTGLALPGLWLWLSQRKKDKSL